MERAGKPRHRSQNPRGEGESEGSDRSRLSEFAAGQIVGRLCQTATDENGVSQRRPTMILVATRWLNLDPTGRDASPRRPHPILHRASNAQRPCRCTSNNATVILNREDGEGPHTRRTKPQNEMTRAPSVPPTHRANCRAAIPFVISSLSRNLLLFSRRSLPSKPSTINHQPSTFSRGVPIPFFIAPRTRSCWRRPALRPWNRALSSRDRRS